LPCKLTVILAEKDRNKTQWWIQAANVKEPPIEPRTKIFCPFSRYATATDYDPRADRTKTFFTTVQNKLHFAVHEHTAAEIIHSRVNNEKPMIGMTNFKGDYITKDDVIPIMGIVRSLRRIAA